MLAIFDAILLIARHASEPYRHLGKTHSRPVTFSDSGTPKLADEWEVPY
jgi:hypothetical protein